jgi:uncharacterized protein YjbI with pentapeptide repeats
MADVRVKRPARPKPPASITLADPSQHELVDEGVYRCLHFEELELTGREADALEFDQCRFTAVDLGLGVFERASFVDCLVERCSLANLRTEASSMIRVSVTASRLTGLQWTKGALRDTSFTDCRMDLSSFRFSKLSSVVFERCNLRQADFQNADLRGTRFEDCELAAAQFSGAQLDGATFARCTLEGIGGVTSLRGARLLGADALSLLRTLTAALGIVVVDGDGPDESP